MKRILILLQITFIAIMAFAESNYRVISELPLNIRTEASADADVLGTFDAGVLIEVVSAKRGWAKVKYNGGFGYVQTRYIDKISTKHNLQTNSVLSNETVAVTPDFESERKSSVYEIAYTAGSFEDVKLTGTYGFSWTMLAWNIMHKLYVGIHFSPLNFNYGLSDFNYDEIRLGPAIGYYFTPKFFVSVPLDVLCDVYFNNEDDTKTAWGMALAPTLYVGKKVGVFVGPQFSVGFSGNSKVACGFRAGIYF